MSHRPPSADERSRLAQIASMDLEAARPSFERIARLAQCVFRTPMVHVSLVEADRLWIAGVSDVALPPVSREHAFADVVVRRERALWVEDAASDKRFKDNPFVTGSQHFRFYAGAPIRLSNGDCVGALSVIDRKPRAHDPFLEDRLTEFAALVADDWERRRALGALAKEQVEARTANQLLSNILDIAPVSLIMTDLDLNVIRASALWRSRVGPKLGGDPTGGPVYAAFPESKSFWIGVRDRCVAGRSVRSERSRFEDADGKTLWIQSEIIPWRGSDGEVGGLLVVTHDITEVVTALEQSERSERRLRLATEMAELHVWEVNHRSRDLKSEGVPPIYEGVSYDELTTHVWKVLHPDDRPRTEALWEKHLADGTPFRTVIRVLQPDGAPLWTSLAVETIRDDAGEVDRVVIVTRNIDREKRAEEAMARALDAAEAANRSKSEFLANMSHEIRTPLNGVMGVAGALARTPLEAAQLEMVELIEGSAEVLENLLSDVLDIARIESGRLELHNEPFDLGATLRGVAALFEPKAIHKGLEFTTDIDPEAETFVRGDATRIRQIVSNLLSNAIKFTDEGRINLGARAKRNGDRLALELVVSDTGIGFDAKFAARLFERFEQADGSITRRFGGTGLGLAISRSLADAMGAALSAKSSPGKGATFTLALELPCAEAGAGRGSRSRTELQQIVERRMNAPKVLLAEDHPTNRKVVALILEAVGVDLTAVENGLAALEASSVRDFDLILMDMQMPVLDGLSAIRAIRDREAREGRPRTPILALTANAMPEHASATMEAGADGHLTKPISAATLVEAVREVCEPQTPEPKLAARAAS
jgi:PAS domain S-box-containing protein